MLLKIASTALQLAGIAFLVAAAWRLNTIVGMVVSGLALLATGFLLEPRRPPADGP